MKVTMFSDYVCPFCYVGQISLKRAMEGLDIELEFHPYELRRYPTPQVDPMHEEKRLKRFEEVIQPMADELHVPMNLPWISPHPYTTLAFQGYYFAEEFNMGSKYNDCIYNTFYVLQQDIGQLDVLCDVLHQLGLNCELFKKKVEDKTYMSRLDEQLSLREALAIQGCPTYLIGNKKITGFHSVEDFRKLLMEGQIEEMTGLSCGIDGCKI